LRNKKGGNLFGALVNGSTVHGKLKNPEVFAHLPPTNGWLFQTVHMAAIWPSN
jgi:hypothetical protein